MPDYDEMAKHEAGSKSVADDIVADIIKRGGKAHVEQASEFVEGANIPGAETKYFVVTTEKPTLPKPTEQERLTS